MMAGLVLSDFCANRMSVGTLMINFFPLLFSTPIESTGVAAKTVIEVAESAKIKIYFLNIYISKFCGAIIRIIYINATNLIIFSYIYVG